jgi:arabinofuranosyltransferase
VRWPRGGFLLLSAGVTLGLGAAVLAFALDHAFSLYDDAYIYLRYVQNLLSGHGLRFNAGDAPVEGFTSPLYLALLALGGLLTDDLEGLTQVLGTLLLTGALIATALGGWRPSLRVESEAFCEASAVVAATALVLGADHYVLLNSVIGLENPLAALVMTALGLVSLGERRRGLRTLLVHAILVRPEALVFVPALLLLPEGRRWRYWIPLVLALGVLALARWLLFQDILPNTYRAKSGGTWEHTRLGLAYLAEVFRDFPVLALAPLALLLPGARPGVSFVLAGTLFWFAFFLRSGGDTFHYSRLAFPLVPLLTLFGLAGLAALLHRLAARLRWRAIWAPFGVLVVAGALATRAALAHGLAPMHGFPNVQRWALVGRYLAHEHPGKSIATVPVGALSYFSGLRVIDLVGITSAPVARAGASVPPELLNRNWIAHERHHTEWVLSQKPDLIVMTEWRRHPWRDLHETRTGFYAEWLLLQAIKQGRAPYRLYDAEVAPGVHWLMFSRLAEAPGTSG